MDTATAPATGQTPWPGSTKELLKWRLATFQPTRQQKRQPEPLNEEARRVVAALDRDGAAVTTVDALIGDEGVWKELQEYADQLAEERAEELAEAHRNADIETPGKSYVFHLVPGPITFTPGNDILARFALHHSLLGVANAYFGMYTRLQNVDIWHTLRSTLPPRDAQLWHRDPPDDRHLVKVFVYLSDVDEGSGPFHYAAGTHAKGNIDANPAATKIKDAWRTTDEQMAEVIPADRWIHGIGPKGTIVIADTRGYHKGGECRDRDRILYHLLYTSSGHRKPIQRYTQPVRLPGQLTPAQRFAVGLP
jgi:hypothetical protein